jgi:hypothetical protein
MGAGRAAGEHEARKRDGKAEETFRHSLTPAVVGPEHDPEKWMPVLGKDHARPKVWSVMTTQRVVITL